MKLIASRHLKTANYAYRQRGASLLEGIAYLGIAAIVVIGAVSLMRSAFSNAQSNQIMQDVVSIRTAVRKLYMGQSGTPYQPGGAAGGMNPILNNARALPDNLAVTNAGATITNTWNGAVNISSAAAGAQFSISYAGVPQDVCINALSGASGWISITVNNAAAPILEAAMPVTTAAANAACNAAANTIVWTAS